MARVLIVDDQLISRMILEQLVHSLGDDTEAVSFADPIEALEWAKKTGRARFVGLSSHDRPHIKRMIETYPEVLDVICTPYTAKTKIITDEHGLWATMQQD